MGNLYRAYGLFDMIQAAKQLRFRGCNIRIELTGRGPDWEEASSVIEQESLRNYICHLGYLSAEDLAARLGAADAFLSPLNDTVADWARCPSKIYMYMAYKKPVVTCRIGENAEALGDSGFYYVPGDAQSMADAIIRAVRYSDSMGPVEYTESKYLWSERAAAYERWLLEVQSEGRL
jgi:glycosyltransferase involved in cell wall biosynthesis